ncbi:MAG: oligosaccharide flippase family protein [Deltaproteobacteria bacterium]|nr:oligosaccharide flippase family protein [Deltaproteobacteria bacterium]
MLRKTIKELGFHSLIYLIGGLASTLASIILLPVYTRFLTPTDYGILEVIDNIRGQLVVILLAGLVPAMAKFYKEADSEDAQKEVIGTAWIFVVSSGLIWLICLFLFDKPSANFLLGNVELVLYIDLGILLLFIQVIFTTGNTCLNIRKQSKLFLIVSLIKLCLNIGANLYFIVGLRLGAKGMLFGELFSSGVVGIFLVGYLVARNGLHFRVHILGQMLKFGLPFIPNLFSAGLMHSADRSILRPRWPSISDIGIYGLGYRFPFMLNFLILGSFGRIWNASVMYEIAKQEDCKRIYAKVMTYFMTVYVVCQYILVVMAPTVIKVLAAPEYFQAWRLVQIVGLGMCFYTCHQFFTTGAFIKSKTWYLPIAYMTAALINISLNWYFLPKYGYTAAAWNTVITYFAFSCVGFFIFRKIYPIPFEFRRLAFLFGTGIVLVLLNNACYVQNSILLECLKEIGFATLLPLILIWGPYLDQDERKTLQEELHKIHPKLALLYIRIQTRVKAITNHEK